jgi:hypothetical protein
MSSKPINTCSPGQVRNLRAQAALTARPAAQGTKHAPTSVDALLTLLRGLRRDAFGDRGLHHRSAPSADQMIMPGQSMRQSSVRGDARLHSPTKPGARLIAQAKCKATPRAPCLASQSFIRVDLTWTYSNRQNLADLLRRARVWLIEDHRGLAQDQKVSVQARPTPDVPRRVVDRLGEDIVCELIEARAADATLREIAKR